MKKLRIRCVEIIYYVKYSDLKLLLSLRSYFLFMDDNFFSMYETFVNDDDYDTIVFTRYPL